MVTRLKVPNISKEINSYQYNNNNNKKLYDLELRDTHCPKLNDGGHIQQALKKHPNIKNQ